MYRQSPSRNQRSKGIKVKYGLQICLLLAVCFWLIYQVKHSHDKKKEFEESDAKASLQKENSDGIIKLGRKDIIRPRDGETTSKNDKLIEEEETIEEEEEEEEEENKPEEEDDPEEKNVEENPDDHEQENSDREEDSVDEIETQEVDSEDGRDQTERESVSEENDRDGDDKSTHEAREEHYKADDASSAVTTHGTQTNENERTENSNEHPEHVLEEGNKENNIVENNTGEVRKYLEVENGEIGRDDEKSNVTTSEAKVDVLDGSENGSPPNKTVIEGPDRDLTSNGSAEVKIENVDLSETKPELDHDSQAIASERTNNPILNAESHSEDFSNSSNNNTESSSEKNDVIGAEKSDISDGTYENSESTVTVNPEEEVQHDSIDVSDMEEKHVRTDLDTLPQIQTEGTNGEDDVAAE